MGQNPWNPLIPGSSQCRSGSRRAELHSQHWRPWWTTWRGTQGDPETPNFQPFNLIWFNSVLLLKIGLGRQKVLKGIPSIIIYHHLLVVKGVFSNHSINQSTNGRGHLWFNMIERHLTWSNVIERDFISFNVRSNMEISITMGYRAGLFIVEKPITMDDNCGYLPFQVADKNPVNGT